MYVHKSICTHVLMTNIPSLEDFLSIHLSYLHTFFPTYVHNLIPKQNKIEEGMEIPVRTYRMIYLQKLQKKKGYSFNI